MDSQAAEEKQRNLISSTSYCYMDFGPGAQEIYNLATGMESMISFPSKTFHHPEFFNCSSKNHNTSGGASSSRGAAAAESEFFRHHQEAMLAASQDRDPYDYSSLRSILPCEGSERPSKGLSLSLSSTIGIQALELRNPDKFFPKSVDQMQQDQDQNLILQDGSNPNCPNGFSQIRGSKYLGPAQDLLKDFCNLGSKKADPKVLKAKHERSTPQRDQENYCKMQPLYALEVLELQKRKTKLLAMLEEVDRRYKQYRDQMKAVVSSFEAVAGDGAATMYSEMASKAMSRHFRCLRDGIVMQIKATKNATGEKDIAGPGTTRGETPRLRLLDQALRQQRAFQQMSMMESHPWRPQRGLPERSVSVLRAWLFDHFLHPYPSDVDKHVLARQTGLSRSQVSNWFINARVRLWKPMVEEMYLEETKEQDNLAPAVDVVVRPSQNQNSWAHVEEQKSTLARLGGIGSECLSSIIINPDKNDSNRCNNYYQRQQQQGSDRAIESFGAMELDISTHPHHQGFGGGVRTSGAVSLTLGLPQHEQNTVSLAFTPTSESSLFYHSDHHHMEDCQPVQFSLFDGEAQNLPYRNLMGAQLLRDLAG